MALITVDQLKKICTSSKFTRAQESNMKSFAVSVNDFGAEFGMDKMYNLSSFIGQVMVESGEFRFDQEIWGPTNAQKRYDTRTDLGNTPQKDGDGEKYKGRGPIQLTGKGNITAFYRWCQKNYAVYNAPKPPNFVEDPSKIDTDPWEGLSALWYWGFGNPEHVSLNKYAEQNNQLMVTKRVNGGTTAYAQRLEYQARAALVLLGYGTSPLDIKKFQRAHPMSGAADGLIGDKTRAALHDAMSGENPLVEKVEVEKPVRVEVPVDKPTVPVSVEKEVRKKTNFYGYLAGAAGVIGGVGSKLLEADWMTVAVIFGGAIALIIILLILQQQVISAVGNIRRSLET